MHTCTHFVANRIDVFADLALPRADDLVAQRSRHGVGALVYFVVADQLRFPQSGVGPREFGSPVNWTVVPEAPVDENRNPCHGEDNVGGAALLELQPNSESEPPSM